MKDEQKLSPLEKFVLRIINVEINMKIKYNMEVKYDLL